MVKGVTDGPRISQDYSNTGMQHTEEAKTPDKLTLPQLNGILDNLGLGTLGGDVEPLATKGTGEDTPRQDGQVRNRGEGVKSFFKAVGKGIGDFFTKIGNAFSNAFDTIKEALTSRTGGTAQAQTPVQTAQTPTTTPKPALDKQGTALKDFCEELGKDLETSYQDYLATTDDEQKMDRTEFVKLKLPDPPGGRDGIDRDSISYVGDRLDDVKANMADTVDPGRNEMRDVLMDRLQEMPTLDIATNTLFEDELKDLETDPTTFLRGNSAFTKLDKFISREAIDFGGVAQNTITSLDDEVKTFGHLGEVDDLRMGMSSLNQEQADAVETVSDKLIDSLLDIGSDDQKSFFNSISQSYRDHLSEKAHAVMEQKDVSLQDRQDSVKTMYVNSLFLRGMSGDLTMAAVKNYGGTTNQNFAVQTMQFVQTFLNGASVAFASKGNDLANIAMDNTVKKHQPRLDAFLTAMGMPDFGETPDTEDQKTITE